MNTPVRLNKRVKAATIRDVALLAGVSAQTVSRVVNQSGYVSATTREKVKSAIKQLGYRPNSVARSLSTKTTNSIGLFVDAFAQSFYPEMTRAIEHVAAQHGFSVHVISAQDSPSHLRNALEHLRSNQFAGVIVRTSPTDFATELQEAALEGFPVVLSHQTLPGIDSTVFWDGYEKSAVLAINHLISVGSRKIACIVTPRVATVEIDEGRGYKAALANAGIPFDPTLIVHAPHSLEGGYGAIAKLLRLHPDIDGVFVASDVRAIGVLRYLALNQRRVPDDVAMVTFGGTSLASMLTPSLSTIKIPRSKLGTTAAEALFDLISGGVPHPIYVHDPPILEIGESTLRIPQSINSTTDRTRIPPGIVPDDAD